MYLIDTNVLCDSTKVTPNPRILSWLETNEPLLRVSVISIGEIHCGIELLENGRKKTDLRKWLTGLRTKLAQSIVPFDDSVAMRWGALKASLEHQGRKLPVIDSLLAATALEHNLILVTSNTKDFLHSGIKLLDPTLEN